MAGTALTPTAPERDLHCGAGAVTDRPAPVEVAMHERTHRTLPLALASALLALGLGTATAQLGVTLGTSGAIDAVIVDVSEDAAPTAARLRTERGDTIAALALRRGAHGLELRGPLPDLSASPLLLAIDAETLWPCPPTVSDPSARFSPSEVFVDGLGVLQPGLQAPLWGETPSGHVMLVLVFSDRAVRVQVTCDPGEDEPGTPLRADLTLDAGWNVLAGSALIEDGVALVHLRTASLDELSAARWYAPPPPHVTPPQPRPERAPGVEHQDAPPAPPAPPARQD